MLIWSVLTLWPFYAKSEFVFTRLNRIPFWSDGPCSLITDQKTKDERNFYFFYSSEKLSLSACNVEKYCNFAIIWLGTSSYIKRQARAIKQEELLTLRFRILANEWLSLLLSFFSQCLSRSFELREFVVSSSSARSCLSCFVLSDSPFFESPLSYFVETQAYHKYTAS